MQNYIFKVSLFDNPKVYREIEVPDNWSVYKFAESIISAFNFDFDHCFGFFSNISERGTFESEKHYELFTDLEDVEPIGSGSVKKTKIKEVWTVKGDKMLFYLDYGDNWKWIAKLIDVNKIKYPKILKKVGRVLDNIIEAAFK
ncbi:MAG: hypothetical protein PHY47_27290 [Lachnospiraceae bacterium]|nr:hypothetical protein [Lachnospiraceae bacterium]